MPPVIRGRWPEGPEGESRRREASDFRSVIGGGSLCGFPRSHRETGHLPRLGGRKDDQLGGVMGTSLIRSRATITGVKDRFTWNEIKDGAVLQEDGVIVAVGTYDDLHRKHPTVPVIGNGK